MNLSKLDMEINFKKLEIIRLESEYYDCLIIEKELLFDLDSLNKYIEYLIEKYFNTFYTEVN
tara:strand:- start:384 stop:569 length:186 start_codon:yes stop_codon:yes gene_type:complete